MFQLSSRGLIRLQFEFLERSEASKPSVKTFLSHSNFAD